MPQLLFLLFITCLAGGSFASVSFATENSTAFAQTEKVEMSPTEIESEFLAGQTLLEQARYQEASFIFQKLAPHSAIAKMRLGLLTMKNQEFSTDKEKGLALVTEAYPLIANLAAKENADALLLLGLCFRDGVYVEKNILTALAYLEKAAQRLPAAQAELGYLYLEGTEVPENLEKTFALFTKGAQQKNLPSLSGLALMYRDGRGVEQNSLAAFNLYSEAAALGLAEGFLNLAALYANGEGVEQNFVKARSMAQKAHELGAKEAVPFLRALKKYTNSTQEE